MLFFIFLCFVMYGKTRNRFCGVYIKITLLDVYTGYLFVSYVAIFTGFVFNLVMRRPS